MNAINAKLRQRQVRLNDRVVPALSGPSSLLRDEIRCFTGSSDSRRSLPEINRQVSYLTGRIKTSTTQATSVMNAVAIITLTCSLLRCSNESGNQFNHANKAYRCAPKEHQKGIIENNSLGTQKDVYWYMFTTKKMNLKRMVLKKKKDNFDCNCALAISESLPNNNAVIEHTSGGPIA
uniref:Uncharacterized protein n=1 Tax=Salmonella sp. TaxID=599 RepID=A0A482EXA4_SALSP|nr:hypothetical protein [Salmonella sp.]QBM91485.1 hypothetical protein NNIBIDOC_00156 [Salmonella sp.]